MGQSAGTAVAQLALGLTSGNGPGLVGGYVIGRSLGILPLFLVARSELHAFSRREATSAFRKYWRYPAIFAPSAVLNGTALALPVLLIGLRFSVDEAGQWGMADRILAIPVVLLGAAVGQVVEAQLAERIRNGAGNFTGYYLKSSAMLTCCGVAVFVGGLFVLPVVAPLYLGPGWSLAADIMGALLLMTCIRLITTPLSRVYLTLQLAKTNLALDVLRVVVLVLVFLWTAIDGASIIATAWAFSISMSAIYLLSWIVGLVSVRAYAVRFTADEGSD